MENKNSGFKGFLVIYAPSAVLDPDNGKEEIIKLRKIARDIAREYNDNRAIESIVTPECIKVEILEIPECKHILDISMPNAVFSSNNKIFKKIIESAKDIGRNYASGEVMACVVPEYFKVKIIKAR